MTEYSFPALEKPLNDQQWKSVTLGIGDGVFDEGGNPYNLIGRSNVSDTATITVDSKKGFCHAILRGFYHKLDAPMTITIPPVTANTKYYITLVYDPLNQVKPVSLKVVTSLDRSSGKEYLVLWTVDRKPNQLLTDTVLTKFRQTISPYIEVDYAENLPEATSVLFGTRAHCLYTGETWRRSFTDWKPASARIEGTLAMPGWNVFSYTNGIAATPVKGGFICTWSGGLNRTDVSYNIPTSWTGPSVATGTPIPSWLRPPSDIFGLGANGNTTIELRITSGGQLLLRSMTGSPFLFTKGSGVSFNFSWFVPESPTARA